MQAYSILNRRFAWSLIIVLIMAAAMVAPASASAEKQLKLISLMPKGQVQRITQIVAVFDRDMVPLGTSGIAAEDSPLKLDPQPKGSFRWLDPRTLAFIPPTPLVGARSVEIRVSANATALDGSKLGKDHVSRVSTPGIKLVRISPATKQPLAPRPRLDLIINQAVTLDSLKKHIWFDVGGKRLPALVEKAEIPAWQRERMSLASRYLVSCPERFPPQTRVTLVLDPGIKPAQGDLALTTPIVVEYQSYGPLRLLKWDINQGPDKKHDPLSGLHLQFNNPVSAKELWKHLDISPALPKPGSGLADYDSRWVNLYLDFKPRSTYRFTFKPGLKDQYGTALDAAQSFDVITGDLWPRLNLPQGKGVLETCPRPLLPLRIRNIDSMQLAMERFTPDKAVSALVADEERPWNVKPDPPKAEKDTVRVHQIKPKLKPNKLVSWPLDLNKLYGAKVQGDLLLVDLRSKWPSASGEVKTTIRRAFVQVTDLGLSLKIGNTGGLTWVSSLKTGEPVARVKLELRDRTNRVMWQGLSNEEGLAELPALDQLNPAQDPNQSWHNPVAYLLAQKDGDFAILPSTWGDQLSYSLPYDLNWERPGRMSGLQAHALVQLPLYQPGQTVRFLVYVRKPGSGAQAVPAGLKLKGWVRDSNGKKVHKFQGTANRYGSLAGSFQLAPGARLGSYEIALDMPGDTIYTPGFRVASFRPPDFKVSLKAPKYALGSGSAGELKIQADYLFGRPVAQGKANLKVSQSPGYFRPAPLNDYAVGAIPLPGKEPEQHKFLGEQNGTLDKSGMIVFKLPKAGPLPGHPVRLNLAGKVSDPSNRAQPGKASVLVHPSGIYLGLKGPLLTQAEKPASIELAASSHDGKLTAPGKVELKAYRQYWETVREKGPGGYFRHLTKPVRKLVWQTTLDMAEPKAKVDFTPPQSGSYILVADAKDKAGRATQSGLYLWASGKGVAGWERYDDHRMDIVPEKTNLLPGQSARLMLKNPFAQARALVTVEREGVRRVFSQLVSGPAPVIEVPMQEADAPGVYIGVLLVRGRKGDPKPGGPDLGKPQVRIGYATIKVKSQIPGLEVAVKAENEVMRPGQEAGVEVRVNQGGSPVQCQLTLLAVDERVLTAAGGANSYDPRPKFNRMTPLRVISADMRAFIIGRVLAQDKGMDQGGGGGMGPGVRQEFHPAVYWLAQGESDAEGRLAARFKLPGTLTAYRVVAVAADGANHFALGWTRIKARQPLQILSALPRFATKGDEFEARVMLQNLSDKPGEVELSTEAKGLSLAEPGSKKVKLSPGQSLGVGFKVKAEQTGPASMTFTAIMNDFSDAARYKLKVIPASQIETVAASGMLQPKEGEAVRELTVQPPPGADPRRGGMKLTLAPSLSAQLSRPSAVLLEYPWECLEQRISKGAAKAFLLTHGKKLGLAPPKDAAKDLAKLAEQVQDFQSYSGGFTYWPGMSRADLFLTAYVLLASHQMESAGFELPKQVKQKAIKYLKQTLKGKRPSNNNLFGRLSETLTLWVLSLEKTPAGQGLESALRRTNGLTPFGLAALMQAAAPLNAPKVIDRLQKQLEGTASISAESLHFAAINPGGLKTVMGSTLRGNAAALWALSSIKPQYHGLHKLAHWVADKLSGKRAISTQEAVFGLWGLQNYLSRQPEAKGLEFSLKLAGRLLAEHGFNSNRDRALNLHVGPDQIMPKGSQKLSIKALGQGSLYWSSRLAFAPAQPVQKPQNAGIGISRSFQTDKGETKVWELGDELMCRLTISNPDTRHHVAVFAPYPAGLEPVGAATGRPVGGGTMQNRAWQWRELRKTGLMLYARLLRPGVYSFSFRMRAVAPGRFVTPPARVEEMYAPEVFGSTAAQTLEVK